MSKNIFKNNWLQIYSGKSGFGFQYNCCEYDTCRHQLILHFIFLHIYILLPWKAKEWSCDPKCYGIETYKTVYRHWYSLFNQIYIRFGNKCKFIAMPWCLEWVYTAIKFKDSDTWLLDDYITRKAKYKGQRFFKNVYKAYPFNYWKDLEYERKNILYDYDYTYKALDQHSHCTYYVCERCWRPKWFKWTNLFSVKNRVIEVDFDEEMGPKKGSWKGGVKGCGFNIKKDETPEECIKRMEKEYIF